MKSFCQERDCQLGKDYLDKLAYYAAKSEVLFISLSIDYLRQMQI